MQHFMHDVQVDNLNIPVECLNVQTATMQQLFNKDLSTGTFNDCAQNMAWSIGQLLLVQNCQFMMCPPASGPSVLPIVYQGLHQSTTMMETVHCHCIWPMHIK